MTNSCYSYRVYDMYRVGADPVKLNLYCRKRLFHKGRLYWTGYDILHKIHEIYTTVIRKIHRTMRRIVRFERIVCRIAKLEASILIALL